MYKFVAAYWAFVVPNQPLFTGLYAMSLSVAICAYVVHFIRLTVHIFV